MDIMPAGPGEEGQHGFSWLLDCQCDHRVNDKKKMKKKEMVSVSVHFPPVVHGTKS